MRLERLPLIISLLPIGGVVTAYVIAAHLGHVDMCVPLFEGCTTISATGRDAPESLVFRATMLPTAVLLILYWRLADEWLSLLGEPRGRAGRTMLWLGCSAALFLIAYTVALGLIGPQYALQRRIGVTLFFSFTFLAQLLFLWRMQRVMRSHAAQSPPVRRAFRIKLAIGGLMLLLGLVVAPLKATYPDATAVENVVEWNFALLMYLFFLPCGAAWRATGFRANLAIGR